MSVGAADNSHCNTDNLQLNGKQVTWSMQLYSVVVIHRYTGVQSAVSKSETQFRQKATSLIPTLSDNKAAKTLPSNVTYSDNGRLSRLTLKLGLVTIKIILIDFNVSKIND